MSRTLPGTRALKTFEAAGRHLNFTRAAQEVGLTPAAVSHQIKEIEAQMGVALFTRTSRRIQLTPAGAVLMEATEDALTTLQRAASRARKMSVGSGHLRLSLSPRFATNWLLPRLTRFRAAHPSIELTFDITDAVRNLDANDVNVAIRFGSGHYGHTQSEQLFDTIIVPVCSPELVANGLQPETPQDLCRHTLCYVDCETENMAWPTWHDWMTAAGIDDFDDSGCVAFPDTGHVVQAVTESNAIGLADLAMIATDLSQGRLVRLFDIGVDVAPDYAYYLVYPESSSQDPDLRTFRDWMLEEAAATAQPISGASANQTAQTNFRP